MVRQKESNGSPGAVPKKTDHPLRQIPTDVLQKARSTFFSFGGALKSRQMAVDSQQDSPKQKQKQTLDIFKGKPKSKSDRLKSGKLEPEFQEVQKQRRKSRTPIKDEFENRRRKTRPMSMGPSSRRSFEYDDDAESPGSYPGDYSQQPRRYDSIEGMECLHPRLVLPVQSDSLGGLDTLDAERPRKKLSFREPEIVSGRSATLGRNLKHMGVNSLARNNRFSLPPDTHDFKVEATDSDLESQAMRIVRTVGQAFEVCHKLTSGSSDQTASGSGLEAGSVLSEIASDVNANKETVSDLCASAVGSGAESAVASTSGCGGGSGSGGVGGEGADSQNSASRPQKLDSLPPPPRKEGRRSQQRTLETPSLSVQPLTEAMRNVELLDTASNAEFSGSQTSITPLSVHHELQLLKEKLEQQSQQTRAAVAQLLLLRDQLAAEQAARCEAQARTHQLLVHNKELLDHITALVAHLQERERGARHTPISVQQLTMVPQAKEVKSGILKSEKLKAQHSSSSENKDAQEFFAPYTVERGPVSPQPSVDRLSVTWADPELSVSSSSTKVNLYHIEADTAVNNMDLRFPPTIATAIPDVSEDEDYTASVSAIMYRRGSTRRSKKGRTRRPSSPFLPDSEPFAPRRRSSVFTTSSGDTQISMDDIQQVEVTQEQIYENIRLHKEVLSSVKHQPLTMRKKLKLVHQAKTYIKRHEGQLQERLAQSKSTRDIMARCNILFATKWQHMKREAANLSNLLIPWELRIKEIESHFGSVVASYFTFLRWLFWVNLVISVILVVFVIVPEILTADIELAGERKVIYDEDKNSSINLLILWEFEGILKCSPIFYGYYTNIDSGDYRLPFAYFMTGLAVYVYSFVATLRKMAENSRMSKLSEKEDECIFSWKLFTGWDFMIGNAETANNRTASIILSFKEALLEEAEKKKDPRNWRIISLRVLVNMCVLLLLVVSAFAVVTVVQRSNEKSTHWWRQNEITIVMSMISNIFPIFFEILGFLEHYHPRKQLRIQLGRIMILNLLNIYSLIFALFSKIDGMTTDLAALKPKENATLLDSSNYDISMVFLYQNDTYACYGIATDCQNCSDFHSSLQNSSQTAIGDFEKEPAAFKKNSTPPSSFNGITDLHEDHETDIPESSTDLNSIDSTTSLINDYSSVTYNFNKIINSIDPPLIEKGSSDIKTSETTTPYDITNLISANTENYEFVKHLKYISILTRNISASESEENSEGDSYDDYNTMDISESNEVTGYIKPSSENDNNLATDQVNLLFTTNESKEFTISNNNETYNSDTTNLDSNYFTTLSPGDTIGDEYVFNTYADIFNQSETPIAEYDVGGSTDFENATLYYSSASVTTSLAGILRNESTDSLTTDELNDNTLETTNSTPFTKYVITDIMTKEYFTTTITDFSEPQDDTSTTNFEFVKNQSTGETDIGTLMYTRDIFLSNTTVSNEDYSTITTVSPNRKGVNLTIKPCYKLMCIEKPQNHSSFMFTKVNNSRNLMFKDNYNHTLYNLTTETKRQLLTLCWETMFGQELVKLTMMDLVLCILGTLFVDFYRAVFVRYMNRCWCWDLEKKFPQYGDFKIAENILHLVNNQGMVWMGLFFSPGLAVLNLVKLVIMMYLRSWAVMTCNVPHEVVFRASRSNNFYLALLLTMLFLCVLPVGYAIVWVTPSWHCGPFSDYNRIYHIFTVNLNKILPNTLKKASDYIASPGIVIPLLVLLILIIYYLLSLTNSLREANNDLKTQLRRERTEERRKMWQQLADRQCKDGSSELDNTPFAKWKKILPILPTSKSIESDERKTSNDEAQSKVTLKRKGDIFAKIVNMARGRPVKEEVKPDTINLPAPAGDDETDTEFHESLPEDVLQIKDIRVVRDSEPVKKKVNVEFKTTNGSEIREDFAKYKTKKNNEKQINRQSDDVQKEKMTSKQSHVDFNRGAKLRFKTRELIKSKILEESKKMKETPKYDPTNKLKESVDENDDDEASMRKKIKKKEPSESSSQSRQSDSVSSVIPMITISKTESDDDMIRDKTQVETKKVAKQLPFVISVVPKKPKQEAERPSQSIKKTPINLKALRRQSSVDSINELKQSKEKKVEEGHKFQYSL